MNQGFDADNVNADPALGTSAAAEDTKGRQPSPLRKIHALLRGRYQWAIILGLIGALAGGGGGYKYVTPLYKSTGLIYVKPTIPQILYPTEESRMKPMFDSFVGSQVELIRNQRVIDMAMKDESWQEHGRISSPNARIKFNQDLKVFRPVRTNLIIVEFQDPTAEAARDAVRAIITAYEKLVLEEDVRNGEHRMKVLQEKRVSTLNELTNLRTQMFAIADEYGPDGVQQLYTYKLRSLTDLGNSIKEAKTLLAEMGEAMNVEEDQENPESRFLTPEEVALAGDRQMRQLLAQKKLLQETLEIQGATMRMGEKHPVIMRARIQLGFIDQAVAKRFEEVQQYVSLGPPSNPDLGNVRITDVKKLKERLAQLNILLAEEETSMRDLARKKREIDVREATADIARRTLEDINLRIETLNTESRVAGRIEIISNGEIPLAPVNSGRRTQLALAGFLVGGVAGIGIVILIGTMDRRFRSSEDAIDRISPVRLLGILPSLPEDFSDPEHARVAGNCLHQIRTMLQINSRHGNRQVFAITSPNSGSGKTSLTMALGFSFAASGSRTLLIDCDMGTGGLTSRLQTIIRRRIGQILEHQGLITSQQLSEALRQAETSDKKLGEMLIELGVLDQENVDHALALQKETRIGLLDALEGEQLDHCVVETSTPDLSILPIGGAKANDVNRLSPTTVRRVIEAAHEQFDTILLDTGPIPGTMEASVIAAEADEVVVIVARGEHRPLAEKAITFLDSIGAHVAGLVFNRAETRDIERAAYLTAHYPATGSDNGKETTDHREPTTKVQGLGPMERAVAHSSRGESKEP